MLRQKTIREVRKALQSFPAGRSGSNAGRKRDATPSYSRSDLEHFRSIILNMRQEVVQDLQVLREGVNNSTWEGGASHSQHVEANFMERSLDAAAQEQHAAMISRQTKLLKSLEAALQRIDEGVYGICVTCGNLIDRERLEVVPHTQQCVHCKTGKRGPSTPDRPLPETPGMT